MKLGIDINRCELIVKGRLVAKGGIVNGDTLKVKFTSAASVPKPGDWYGIRFLDTSDDTTCIIAYATDLIRNKFYS